MIEAVTKTDSSAGLFFSGVEGMVYDLSSEIIHGSLYGYEDFNGILAQETHASDHLMSHFETVLFSACLSSAALARLLATSMAPIPEMEAVEKQAFWALRQFVPDEMQRELPNYFS
jgi:hypothetical protein